MDGKRYSTSKKVRLGFDEAVERTREELAHEGFGILTEIDVKSTLKKKIDVDFDNYMILGACDPSFAYKALRSEREIGLLLPCNVLVYENEGSVFVSAILPTVAMSFIDNEPLAKIAVEIEKRLVNAIDRI